MYCSGCGQAVAPGQAACAHCGKPTVIAAPMSSPAGYGIYSRVQRHVQTLGILWLAYSLVGVAAWFVAIPFLGFIFGHAGHNFAQHEFPFPVSWGWIISMMTIVIYVRAALGLLVAFGLLRRERWARTLAIIVAILSLIKFPFGTALGIYTLWVLMPMQSAQEYDAVAGL